MSRLSMATPCPAPTLTGSRARRLSTLSTTSTNLGDDTCTLDLDYTRAAQSELRKAPPRRKSTFQRKADRHVGITIFEDVVEDQELLVEQPRIVAKSTLLSKPAQRRQHLALVKGQEWMGAQPLDETGQARRRISIMPSASAREEVREEQAAPPPKDMKEGLKKNPRRRTIFVPTEDTTIMTIHPGANTTNRLNDTFHLSNSGTSIVPQAESAAPVHMQPPQRARSSMAVLPDIFSPLAVTTQPPSPLHTSTTEPLKPARKPRMSLAVAPKRLPLQHLANKQGSVPGLDIAGHNGGKENVPPGMTKLAVVEEKPSKPVPAIPAKTSPGRSKLFEPTAASQARRNVVPRKVVPLPKPQCVPGAVRSAPAPVASVTARSTLRKTAASLQPRVRRVVPASRHNSSLAISSPSSGSDKEGRRTKCTSPTMVRSKGPSRVVHYAVLTEDIAQPQLYEDSWLSHQEVALTELINGLFYQAAAGLETWQAPQRSLRERMIAIYHQPDVSRIHQRLQASLQHGALSRARSSASMPSPSHDIGLRRRFLNLWLNTYDEEALRAAAEVVIGRQVPRTSGSLPMHASENIIDPSKGRRALIGFLETFLIKVEDVDVNEWGQSDTDEDRRWGKMILRSLMMVWLLDQCKAQALLPGCLFNRKAVHKSSTTVLHALTSMFIPSVGDITRTLRHLDFEVIQSQDPLDEVVYKIENLAVDLRDGIFLTRLVEVLLFHSRQQQDTIDQAATVTISLPDTTLLESALSAADGTQAPKVLSQHLKMPCLGNAQKLHNVQIALSALTDHSDLARNVLQDVTAEDVVHGHREKTLSLLWALVSHHGLAQLVDWEELTRDITRAGGRLPDFKAFADNPRESLLEAWAVAHAKRKGAEVRNLTTSFADAQAYAAILDNFSSFLPTPTANSLSAPKPNGASSRTTLETKLRSLGCSQAFTKQLASIHATIPSRETTISNLVFLASRLLPLARRCSAAELIQRAYRRVLGRRRAHQRVLLMRVAHACAAVAQAHNRIVDAAITLQRAWRAVVDSRIARLNSDVVEFQILAKGWAARRRVRRGAAVSGAGFSGAVGQSSRIMGGW
ncbi:abnormal spindle-like microcephaly-associated protein [Teratosphaeria destructans]|uniref:Abnormal spindle-like microcephaly-associated protein n=1 Tax=Teratosphaeria destructans TaxID=418781 RepID=A0A9W7SKG3_9PEZI|nr:abnormal spindle-like microcephaly-associated protein [Teratosphaeria destructans]